MEWPQLKRWAEVRVSQWLLGRKQSMQDRVFPFGKHSQKLILTLVIPAFIQVVYQTLSVANDRNPAHPGLNKKET